MIVDDMVAKGDKVAVRGTVKATHTGDLMGIPPTGKEVAVPFLIIYRIAESETVAHWMASDQLGLMQQLGVIPPMGG